MSSESRLLSQLGHCANFSFQYRQVSNLLNTPNGVSNVFRPLTSFELLVNASLIQKGLCPRFITRCIASSRFNMMQNNNRTLI